MERQAISLSNLDFQGIKEDLKQFLQSQNQFLDYDFEGSSLDVLLSVLAYNAQNQSFLANMVANEMFMDSALLRKNIVSIAKLMGYTPRSITSPVAVVKIEIVDLGNPNTTLLLPRGTKFTTVSSGVSYDFVTMEDYNLVQAETAGHYVVDGVVLREGKLAQFAWVCQDGSRYILPTADIDVDTLKLIVYPTQFSSSFEVFTKASEHGDFTPESKVFWIQESDGSFELKFGDGVLGKKLQNGNTIYAEYLRTSGTEANGASSFSLQGTFSGYNKNQITVTTMSKASGGAAAETSNSIKFNAQRQFASQNRAVTANDFNSMVSSVFPSAKSVKVWGGEESTPPKYGKVFVSIITDDERLLTAGEKSRVESELKRKCSVGSQAKVIDPSFIYLRGRVFVKVRREFVESMSNLSTYLKTKITTWLDDQTGRFDSTLYYSKFLQYVTSLSSSIYSARGEFILSKKLVPYLGKTVAYGYSFVNELVEGTVFTNAFKVLGDTTEYNLTDDKFGNLWMTRLSDNVQTEKVGTVDYVTGEVTLTLTLTSVVGDSIEVFAKPSNEDVSTVQNNALVTRAESIQVELEAV